MPMELFMPPPPFRIIFNNSFNYSISKGQKETMRSQWLPLRERQAPGLLPLPYRPVHPCGMQRDRKTFSDLCDYSYLQDPQALM